MPDARDIEWGNRALQPDLPGEDHEVARRSGIIGARNKFSASADEPQIPRKLLQRLHPSDAQQLHHRVTRLNVSHEIR
jgi:hypothetical protein